MKTDRSSLPSNGQIWSFHSLFCLNKWTIIVRGLQDTIANWVMPSSGFIGRPAFVRRRHPLKQDTVFTLVRLSPTRLVSPRQNRPIIWNEGRKLSVDFVSVSPAACRRRGQPVVTHDRVTEAEGMPSPGSVRSTRCLCCIGRARTRTPLKESSNSKPPKPPSSLSTLIPLSFLHVRQVPHLNTKASKNFWLYLEGGKNVGGFDWENERTGKGGRKRGFRGNVSFLYFSFSQTTRICPCREEMSNSMIDASPGNQSRCFLSIFYFFFL